ncbi:MAG: gamma-glutamyl-gamma-aminobutyrate hydrolase family protein [Planctomycetes bacterium]|nr:gamma-glutamyl-gamma-aminobutyrate hydrolase family protein [Planctomycetota bacterium]
MQSKPLIALNCDLKRESDKAYAQVSEAYYLAVEEAGGLPILLPPLLRPGELGGILARIDGLVLIGGPDIHPSFYGQRPGPHHNPMEARREQFDVQLAREAWDRGLPTLGICFGAQLLNIARGGDLLQHIPSDVPRAIAHSGPDADTVHEIRVEPGSLLHSVLGAERIEVASRHHQAVGRVGEGFKVAARAADGVIEAIEAADDRFILGVQFHPERTPGPVRAGIFRALLAAIPHPGGVRNGG